MKGSDQTPAGWFVIRCEPGREAALQNDVLDRLTLHRLESKVEKFFIPSEIATGRYSDGRRSCSERTYGLLLVRATLDEPTARCISETPGVQELIRSIEESERLVNEAFGLKESLSLRVDRVRNPPR